MWENCDVKVFRGVEVDRAVNGIVDNRLYAAARP